MEEARAGTKCTASTEQSKRKGWQKNRAKHEETEVIHAAAHRVHTSNVASKQLETQQDSDAEQLESNANA